LSEGNFCSLSQAEVAILIATGKVRADAVI